MEKKVLIKMLSKISIVLCLSCSLVSWVSNGPARSSGSKPPIPQTFAQNKMVKKVPYEYGEFKPGSEPDGFGGIKWGTNILTLKNMVDSGDGFYRKRNDKLTIGNVKLYDIWYYFKNNKLYAVTIFFNNQQYELLKKVCEEMYGKPEVTISNSLNWNGDITLISLKKYIPGSPREGLLHFQSSKLTLESIARDKMMENLLKRIKEIFK
jgi:hypothetical protein